MSCGLPIVTTPVGAILEAVWDGESALVVPPRDAPALTAAIGRLLDDSRLATRFGHAAHHRAETNCSQASMLSGMEVVFLSSVTAKEMCGRVEVRRVDNGGVRS